MGHCSINTLQAAAVEEPYLRFEKEDASPSNKNREDIRGYVANLHTKMWLNCCPPEMRAVHAPVTDVDQHGLNTSRPTFEKASEG